MIQLYHKLNIDTSKLVEKKEKSKNENTKRDYKKGYHDNIAKL